MLARLWVHRLMVALLAAAYGVLLPAHHHGGAHEPHESHAAAGDGVVLDEGDEHEHEHDHEDSVALAEFGESTRAPLAGHGPADGEHHDPHGDGGSGHGHPGGDCGICHAVRTLYTPVAAPLPVMAPQAVAAAVPADTDDVVSVRPRPAYQGRAPPVFF